MSINQLSRGSAALGALMVGYLAEIISIKFAFQFIGLSSFFIIFFGAMLTASIILKKNKLNLCKNFFVYSLIIYYLYIN